MFEGPHEGVEFLLARHRRLLAHSGPQRRVVQGLPQCRFHGLEELTDREYDGNPRFVEEHVDALDVLGEFGTRHAGSKGEERGGIRFGQCLDLGVSIARIAQRSQRIRNGGLPGRISLVGLKDRVPIDFFVKHRARRLLLLVGPMTGS